MELRENMYIRYVPTLGEYTQKISKITNIKNCMLDMCYILDNKEEVFSSHFDEIIKASDKLIDLIKHKDIILGKDGNLYQCWKVYKDYVFTYSKNKQGQTITLVDYQIDKVMCYEQFDQMNYKVGE